jgi:hypothetical protein
MKELSLQAVTHSISILALDFDQREQSLAANRYIGLL